MRKHSPCQVIFSPPYTLTTVLFSDSVLGAPALSLHHVDRHLDWVTIDEVIVSWRHVGHGQSGMDGCCKKHEDSKLFPHLEPVVKPDGKS